MNQEYAEVRELDAKVFILLYLALKPDNKQSTDHVTSRPHPASLLLNS